MVTSDRIKRTIFTLEIKGGLKMMILHIWTINGECRDIPITEDMLDYEISVLESDPFVKEYSVSSL